MQRALIVLSAAFFAAISSGVASGTPVATIPPEFHGPWAPSSEDCLNTHSTKRIDISERGIKVYELAVDLVSGEVTHGVFTGQFRFSDYDNDWEAPASFRRFGSLLEINSKHLGGTSADHAIINLMVFCEITNDTAKR